MKIIANKPAPILAMAICAVSIAAAAAMTRSRSTLADSPPDTQPAPASQPVKVWHSVDEIMATIPPEDRGIRKDYWPPTRAHKAAIWLAQNLMWQHAEIDLKVFSVHKATTGPHEGQLIVSCKDNCDIVCYFNPPIDPKAAAIHEDQHVTIAGQISQIGLNGGAEQVWLTMSLSNCSVKQ